MVVIEKKNKSWYDKYACWETSIKVRPEHLHRGHREKEHMAMSVNDSDNNNICLSYQQIAIHVCVVNFDALAQASDIRIERRQVVFLCWMQDSNPSLRHLFASRLNACRQTDYDQQAFSPLDLTASWLSHLALAITITYVYHISR